MNRATALKLLAAMLTTLLVASAFPLAEVLLNDSWKSEGSSSASGSTSTQAPADVGPLPFDGIAAGTPGSTSGLGHYLGTPLPGFSQDAFTRGTGSPLLDQIIGAAALMGHELALPDLPLDRIAAKNPLRHAILAWVAATGADADPVELSRELARADALPATLQRDLALVILSAADATILQRQALSLLTPDEIAWIRANPHVGEQLAAGITNPDTLYLAGLAGRVDITKSLQATLLVLQAVEVTRGSLSQPAAQDAVAALPDAGLDPHTRAILAMLASVDARTTDQDKVRFAADLVALSAGVEAPARPADVTFADALAALMSATRQQAAPDALADVLARADALPADLTRALARILAAQAVAVDAADPANFAQDGQARALVGVLHAVADALPTLEKYAIHWRALPDDLRIAQRSDAARAGWALEAVALQNSARADPLDALRAAQVATGAPLVEADVPRMSFEHALEALAIHGGVAMTEADIERAHRAGATLQPVVRDAAARMIAGAAESARYHELAFARVTPEELEFLMSAPAVDTLLLKSDITAGEAQTLARIADIAARIDRDALARSQVVALKATLEAREMLAGDFRVQGDARAHRGSFLDLLAQLVPFRGASAQGATCVDMPEDLTQSSIFGLRFENDCANDVLLIVKFSMESWATDDAVVITGPGASSHAPRSETASFFQCPASNDPGDLMPNFGGPPDECVLVEETNTLFGAPNVHIDLGGSDKYGGPVATVHPGQPLPVSLLLEMGGADTYEDPSDAFDASSPIWKRLGIQEGYSTQGAALGVGVAILVDADGADTYDAPDFSQGFAKWGLGLLLDLGSFTDTYRAGASSQGAAGRDMNVGLSILLDQGGDDAYRVESGHGYGLGGFLVDLGGRDQYKNEHEAYGVPVFHLQVLPEDRLLELHQRGDDRFWLDGPGELNVGIGIDTEALLVLGSTPGDNDGFSDFVETLAGTDPKDGQDSPLTNPTARYEKIAKDTDEDSFPDFIERALSTDPKSAASAPVGVPRGPTFVVPLFGEVRPADLAGGDAEAARSDKIVDLRLPLQDAGSLDFACTGNAAVNLTFPTGTVAQRTTPSDACVFVGYRSDGPGSGQFSDVDPTRLTSTDGAYDDAKNEGRQRNVTYRMPAGILAIGDTVDTNYTIDYFLVLDLGGDDAFTSRAGGALPVTTASARTTSSTDANARSFFAPSLVLNVDVAGNTTTPTGDVGIRNHDRGTWGNDRYAPAVNSTGDLSQGAAWGVLIDTAGDDVYTAGSGSQGALGGVLLDLAGNDRYRAKDVSQGATLVNTPPANRAGYTQVPVQSSGTTRTDAVGTLLPGFHLDLGTGHDLRIAGNLSQGAARGFEEGTPANAAPAMGILLDQGGHDEYRTVDGNMRGAETQGVGSARGLGILADLDGNDKYVAWGVVSQGAPLSASYRATERDHDHVGGGILVDAGGRDVYLYHDGFGVHNRSLVRADNLTIQRGDAFVGENGAREHRYVQPGVHLDTESSDANVALNTLAGDGSRDFTSAQEDPTTLDGFYVDIKTARLAIGSPADTTYAHEYAFVVDMGGSNHYRMNAGGFVPDLLARRDGEPNSIARPRALSMFPVSLVLDLGVEDSVYEAVRSMSQGAGFFGVGLLVDMGGNDVYRGLPTTLPALNATWMPAQPIVDGQIPTTEWGAIPAFKLNLTGMNDSRYVTPIELRVANDDKNLYVAIQTRTLSNDTTGIAQDRIFLDLNAGRDARGWSDERGATSVDSTIVIGARGCVAEDHGLAQGASVITPDAANRHHAKVGCTAYPDGTVIYEIVKPLAETYPRDAADLSLTYDKHEGYSEKLFGFRIAHFQKAAGETFAWPPGTARIDGGMGHARDSSLASEMAEWAGLGIANLGKAGKLPVLNATPVVSQGASLAGVGVLAQLGTLRSGSTLYAGDFAQSWAGYGGLALLLDNGGSDTYVGGKRVQGAAEANGLAIFVEGTGNDNYVNDGQALGADLDDDGRAIFLDLGGHDEYRDSLVGGDSRGAATSSTALGDLRTWMSGLYGRGVDWMSDDDARSRYFGTFANQLYGSSITTLSLSRPKEIDGVIHCGITPLGTAPSHGRPILNETVCFRATVALNKGTVPNEPTAGALVTVEAVDFLVDGHRIGTVFSKDDAKVQTLDMLVNVSFLQDGVKTLRAQTILRAEQEGRGAVVFYDRAPNGNERSIILGVIDNGAHADLSLAPEFRGEVDAVFSPFSATQPDALSVLWNVSHDAAEERYGAIHGYQAPPRMSNVPCTHTDVSNEARLCNLLPFWIKVPNERWDTRQPNYGPEATPQKVARQQTGNDNAFIRTTEPFQTELVLYKENAFRLHLAAHNATLPSEYTTYVNVTITDATGAPLCLTTSAPGECDAANLATGVYVKNIGGVDASGTLNDPTVQGAYRAAVAAAVGGIRTAAGALSAPIGTAADVAAAVCTLSQVAVQHYCETIHGDPVRMSNNGLCRDGGNTLQLRKHVQSIPWPEPFGPAFPCTPSIHQFLVARGHEIDPQVAAYTQQTADAIEKEIERLDTPADDGIGWTDFFVDIGSLEGLPPGVVVEDADQNAVRLQPGYGLQLRMTLWPDGFTKLVADTLEEGVNTRRIYEQDVLPVVNDGLDDFERGPSTTAEHTLEGADSTGAICNPKWVCEPHNMSAYQGQRDNLNKKGDDFSQYNARAANPVTTATFLFGDASNPSRLEMRTIAEPSTTVAITVEDPLTSETVATVRAPAPAVGDVADTPRRGAYLPLGKGFVEPQVTGATPRYTEFATPFDGKDDAGEWLPDGAYTLRVRAFDAANQHIVSDRVSTFLLDKTPPASFVLNGAYAGTAAVQGGSTLTVTWDVAELGAGLKRSWILAKAGASGIENNGTWELHGPFAEHIRAFPFQGINSNVKDYYFVVVAEDRAGNIERGIRDGATLTEMVRKSAQAKIDAGQFYRIEVDQTRPVLLGSEISGGARIAFRGGEFEFVQAGAPVNIAVCARDVDNGIASVQFILDYLDPETQTVKLSKTYTGSSSGSCNGGTRYAYTGWGALNADKEAFPDGVWTVTADIYDVANNRLSVGVGRIVLDSVAPQVVLEAPIYPHGQSAVKPGDRLVLRLRADDAFGVDESSIRMDVSSLSTAGEAASKLRRISGVLYHEVDLVVDRADVADGLHRVNVRVPDNAGNVLATYFDVLVDFKRFEIVPGSARVLSATHNSVTLAWDTTENTTSQARFGTSPTELKGKSTVNGSLVKTHVHRIEGLQPSTRYFLRAVSATPGGFVNESVVLEATTLTALFLEPIGPASGALLQGAVPVQFKGGLRDDDGFVSYTLEAQRAPDAEWAFVTTLTEGGDEHTLTFNSTRFLDASTYRLRVKAEAGKDVASIVLGPFTSDNTLPELLVLGPRIATNDTTPRVLAEATDALSGFGASAATLLIDGARVDGVVTETVSGKLRIQFDVPSALSAGTHTFQLTVRDRAGNAVTESWQVAIDGEAPQVTANAPTYAPGPHAARKGGAVTLNLTVRDTSGVRSVVADTGGLASADITRLARVTGTDFFVGTFTVTAADDEETRRVIVTAVDEAGNARIAGVDVIVDNLAPNVGEPRVVEVAQTRAKLELQASEPITLVVTATAAGSPAASASTTVPARKAEVTLDGLLPSRTYSFQVKALDRAGNAVDLSGRFQTELDLTPPSRVEALSVVDLLDGTLRLSWPAATDDIGVAAYRVYRSDDGVTFRPIAEVQGLVFEDADLPFEKSYVYQVVAVDHGGNEGSASERLRAAATAVPRLTGALVTPTVGSTSTVFRYEVTYVSPGGVLPKYVRVIIDGAVQEMTLEGGAPETGLTYAYETRLAPDRRDEPHTYIFEASDGRYTVRSGADALRGPLVSGDVAAGGGVSGVGFAQRVPLVGVAGIAGAVVLAAAAAFILRRRESQ